MPDEACRDTLQRVLSASLGVPGMHSERNSMAASRVCMKNHHLVAPSSQLHQMLAVVAAPVTIASFVLEKNLQAR
jgi:hypothetical protein